MSQPPDENIQREQKLNRRSWQGLLLMFVVGSLSMMGMVAGTLLITTAVSTNTDPSSAIGLAILAIVLIVGLTIGGLWLYFSLFKWSLKPEQQRRARGAAIIQRVLPDVALEPETRPAKEPLSPRRMLRLSIEMIITFSALMIVLLLLERGFDLLWPTAPQSLKLIIFMVLTFAGGGLLSSVRKRHTKKPALDSTSAAVQPPQPPMSRAQIVAMLFFFAFIFLPTLIMIEGIIRLIRHPLLSIPVVFGGFLLMFLLLFSTYVLVPHFWIMAAARRADYDTAIRRARLIQKFSAFRAFYLTLEGLILLWSGHPEEARQIFIQSVTAGREILSSGSVPLQNVGCALTALGRYDEAIQFLEGAIAIKADRGGVFNDLADVYLRQGVEAQRALELTDRALQAHRGSFEERWLERHVRSEILGNRAWALALLDRHAEAEQVLQQAFKVAPRDFVHVQAGLHYRAGHIQQLRADQNGAREQYTTAQHIEPNGSYGQLAAQALQAIKPE